LLFEAQAELKELTQSFEEFTYKSQASVEQLQEEVQRLNKAIKERDK
jgi:hypothetical protein